MAITDQRQTVLQIINRVQRKLAINQSTTLTQTSHTTLLLDLLNEVVSECTDFGRWQELYQTVNVTAQASVASYVVEVSAVVHDIFEIVFDDQIAALDVKTLEDIRRLQRMNSFGVPRQWGVMGTDPTTGNPVFGVAPCPSAVEAGQLFNIAYYIKPPLYLTTDAAVLVPLPADVVFQGTYAKALLEDNGGEPTRQFQAAYQEYERMKNDGINRYNADSGTDVYFTPTGPRF